MRLPIIAILLLLFATSIFAVNKTEEDISKLTNAIASELGVPKSKKAKNIIAKNLKPFISTGWMATYQGSSTPAQSNIHKNTTKFADIFLFNKEGSVVNITFLLFLYQHEILVIRKELKLGKKNAVLALYNQFNTDKKIIKIMQNKDSVFFTQKGKMKNTIFHTGKESGFIIYDLTTVEKY